MMPPNIRMQPTRRVMLAGARLIRQRSAELKTILIDN